MTVDADRDGLHVLPMSSLPDGLDMHAPGRLMATHGALADLEGQLGRR